MLTCRTVKKARKPLRKEQKALLLIAAVFMLYLIAFNYIPIAGWALSLFKYKPAYGLNFARQKFVRFDNFVKLWRERQELLHVLKNTLVLSGLSLLCSPLPMVLAILFMEIRSKSYMRVAQTVTTFPNFISWIIIYPCSGGRRDHDQQRLLRGHCFYRRYRRAGT